MPDDDVKAADCPIPPSLPTSVAIGQASTKQASLPLPKVLVNSGSGISDIHSSHQRLLEQRSALAIEELSGLIVDVEGARYPKVSKLKRVCGKFLDSDYLPAVQQKFAQYLSSFTVSGGEVRVLEKVLGLEVLEASASLAEHDWEHYQAMGFVDAGQYQWEWLVVQEIVDKADPAVPFHVAATAEAIGVAARVAFGFAYDSFKWSNLRFLSQALLTLRTCFQQVTLHQEAFGEKVAVELKRWLLKFFDDVERVSGRLGAEFVTYVQLMRKYAQLERGRADEVEVAIRGLPRVVYIRYDGDSQRTRAQYKFCHY